MNTYIAFLRGINVGGKNIIKMKDLKMHFENAGLSEVQTYIQSGNILFRSESDEKSLIELIEGIVQSEFELTVPVIIRTFEELNNILSRLPFSEEEIVRAEKSSDAESLYVALLTHNPFQENIEKLLHYQDENEKCEICGREVYLIFSNSIRNSRFAANLHKLDASATVRNWKTLLRLNELSNTSYGGENEK